MRKKTRSILEELNNIGRPKDNNDASELERRFINSIKSGDPRKFKRSINRIIESKKNDNT